MAKTGPVEFIKQVDEERRKVTWTTRQETLVTSIMVFIMVTIAALFFLAIDQVLGFAVKFLIGLGG